MTNKIYTNEAVATKVLAQKNKKIEDAALQFKLIAVAGGHQIVAHDFAAQVLEDQT